DHAALRAYTYAGPPAPTRPRPQHAPLSAPAAALAIRTTATTLGASTTPFLRLRPPRLPPLGTPPSMWTPSTRLAADLAVDAAARLDRSAVALTIHNWTSTTGC